MYVTERIYISIHVDTDMHVYIYTYMDRYIQIYIDVYGNEVTSALNKIREDENSEFRLLRHLDRS